MSEVEKKRIDEIVIDPKELRESTCHIRRFLDGKVAVCKGKDGKIRIYEVDREEA